MKFAATLALKLPQAVFAKPETSGKKKEVFNDGLLMPFYAAMSAPKQNKAESASRKYSLFAWYPFL